MNRVQDSFTMELAGIIVREDLLGKGIGSLLLSKCIEFAREAGFVNMVVKTEMSNERAINFYMKKGFVRVGDTVDQPHISTATNYPCELSGAYSPHVRIAVWNLWMELRGAQQHPVESR